MPSLSPLLINFAPEDLALLSSYGESLVYAPGDSVLTEGEKNRYLYLVLKGSLEVMKSGDGGTKALGQVGTTGSLGEMSIFDPGPVSATVKAAGEVEVGGRSAFVVGHYAAVRCHSCRCKSSG